MAEPKQYCGNCGCEVPFFARYPRYICRDCYKFLCDRDGRRVLYSNTHPLGYGCQGYYADSEWEETYDSPYCYIGNKRFYAQEARFGGIVVQLVPAEKT
jgi:hypothetical protein